MIPHGDFAPAHTSVLVSRVLQKLGAYEVAVLVFTRSSLLRLFLQLKFAEASRRHT